MSMAQADEATDSQSAEELEHVETIVIQLVEDLRTDESAVDKLESESLKRVFDYISQKKASQGTGTFNEHLHEIIDNRLIKRRAENEKLPAVETISQEDQAFLEDWRQLRTRHGVLIQEVLKLLARKPKHLIPIIEALQKFERLLKGVFYYDNLGDKMDVDDQVFAGDPAEVPPCPEDCKLQQTISMRNPASALDMGLTIEGVVIDTVLKAIGPNTSRGLPTNDYRLVIQRSTSPEMGEKGDAVYQHLTYQASRRTNISIEQRDLLARHEFNNELHLARDKEERPLREQVKRKLEKAGKQFGNP